MIVNQQYYICMNEQIFALLNTKYALNWCLFNNYCILHILYKINLNYLCRRDSLFTTLTRNYRKFQTKNFQVWEVERSGPPCSSRLHYTDVSFRGASPRFSPFLSYEGRTLGSLWSRFHTFSPHGLDRKPRGNPRLSSPCRHICRPTGDSQSLRWNRWTETSK